MHGNSESIQTLLFLNHSPAAAAKSRQACPTLCDPIDSNLPGSCPWDSLGKNTGVGYHFLLHCMKVKSEHEVTQLCPTLLDPMDCSLPGSSVHGISQARVLEWGAIAFSKTTPLVTNILPFNFNSWQIKFLCNIIRMTSYTNHYFLSFLHSHCFYHQMGFNFFFSFFLNTIYLATPGPHCPLGLSRAGVWPWSTPGSVAQRTGFCPAAREVLAPHPGD